MAATVFAETAESLLTYLAFSDSAATVFWCSSRISHPRRAGGSFAAAAGGRWGAAFAGATKGFPAAADFGQTGVQSPALTGAFAVLAGDFPVMVDRPAACGGAFAARRGRMLTMAW